MFGVPVPPPKASAAKPVAVSMLRQKTLENEELKKELLKVLLEVYMSDGCVLGHIYQLPADNVLWFREASRGRAAHLLSSQAMNLDVLDVRYFVAFVVSRSHSIHL